MDAQKFLYWEVVKEKYSNELLLHKTFNPLRDYEEEFIDGPILELGCGQSPLLIEYSGSGREIYAVDNEPYQLQELEQRIIRHSGKHGGRLKLLNLKVLENELPKQDFALVVLSNLLHFFTLEECTLLAQQIAERTLPGSLLYISVHSQKHPGNKPRDPEKQRLF